MANWMSKAFGQHPGALHRALGVKPGAKISAKKASAARKRARPQQEPALPPQIAFVTGSI